MIDPATLGVIMGTRISRLIDINPTQAVGAAAGAGLLVLILNNPSTFVAIAFVIFAGGVVLWFFNRSRRTSAHEKLFCKIAASIAQHENALISYYHQTRREDLFGNRDEARWHERIDIFLKTQCVSEITDFPSWRRTEIGSRAAAMVDRATTERVAAHKEANPLARVDAASLTPLEYEQHCGELLKTMGWNIRMTPATRDGGADFIAEKQDWRMVVQCKRYAQPVGNKAVQEVHSAVSLYNGNIACVVAPTGFTRQAQQEAHSHSVHLLHHSALPAFAEQLAA